MKRYLLIPLLLCIFSLSAVYSYTVSADLSESLLRLHIIANSNSDADQALKLAVRDEIIKSATCVTKPETAARIALDVLKDHGVNYGVNADITRCYVPEKSYKNVCLPEGYYTCLRVVLGNGNGENWWCIAYPPLCFCEEVFGEMTESSMALLENRLSSESFRAIVKNGDVNFRFKIVEEFQKLRTAFSNF